MKRFNFYIIFIVISTLWLGFFGYNFLHYLSINKELSSFHVNQQDIDKLNSYEGIVRKLERKYENISRQTFTSKSTSEFIATLPKLGELSGLDSIKIESQGVSTEDNLEKTVLKISTTSLFPQIANFIDFLERSKLPIQITSLNMKFVRNKLQTRFVLHIYKKNIEE